METLLWQPLILIVDDNINNLALVERILAAEGYQVRTETSSTNVLATVENVRPDLILLDISMPVIDGYEVCRRLKEIESLKKIPVIFLSAMSDVFDKVKAFSMGGVDYIPKPIELEEFIARVDNHLKIARLQKQLEKKNTYLEAEINRRVQAEADLKRMASTDPLTQIFNRRSFFEFAKREMLRSQRLKTPLSLIMMDIDHFKKVNDSWGHDIGDQVLVAFVNLCQESLRSYDIFARYGGEEFIILLPETDTLKACGVAERLRSVIENCQLLPDLSIHITISLGVVSRSENPDLSFDELVKKADQVLYRAKHTGRNRVEC